jgi:elongation factor P
MASFSTNEFKNGLKLLIDGNPMAIVENEFVKPGKGQAFVRTRLKHLTSGRVIEKTFKSGEKVDLADVEEANMRMLYAEQDGVVFMDDTSFEQVTVPFTLVGDNRFWLVEEQMYHILFYKGEVVAISPPTFLDLKITETAPGVRGDTASGRVLKPATVETGAVIQVPIFVEEGERVKVDTRTGEYVSRC